MSIVASRDGDVFHFRIDETRPRGMPDSHRIVAVAPADVDNLPLVPNVPDHQAYDQTFLYWLPTKRRWVAFNRHFNMETTGSFDEDICGPYLVPGIVDLREGERDRASSDVIEISRELYIYRNFKYYLQLPSAEPEDDLVALTTMRGSLKVVALSRDGTYRFLDPEGQSHRIGYLVSLQDIAVRSIIGDFERLINHRAVRETHIQEFFEQNPAFLLEDTYVRAHPHVVLTRESHGPLIPDFVLEPAEQDGLCDLLEVKLPSARIYLNSTNRPRFSAQVVEAVAQLREYGLHFDETANREALFGRFGLRAYKPRLFLVIGRRGEVDAMAASRIASDMPSLVLRTYDDLILRMRTRARLMLSGQSD